MTLGKTVAQLRTEYGKLVLHKEDLHTDPFLQFEEWFALAVDENPAEANVMALGTVSEGQPSVRIVLLKGFDEDGFVFFTNYDSRKSVEMEETRLAALTFWWSSTERQVRLEGRVERVSAQESDEYFYSRDRGSRVGAWASEQSHVIPDREHLDERVAEVTDRYEGEEDIPRPKNWGGWRLIPHHFEFWQGRENRLHDRFRYKRNDNGKWEMDRLAP